MSNRVPQGKGSSDRTRNRDAYNANFDSIRWPSREKSDTAAGKPDGRTDLRKGETPQPGTRSR